QCALGGGDELGRLPQLGGDGDGGRLVGGPPAGAQGGGGAGDAVALGGVELRHAAGFERDAQVAQLVLVALEHAGECFVAGAVGVAVDGFADALGGDEGAGGQQRDHEVHQPLDFGNPHSRQLKASVSVSFGGRAGQRVGNQHAQMLPIDPV